jgi:pteridine reductase
MQEQVALVTGGARRVGAATVRALHSAGARVVIHYHESLVAAQALAGPLEATRADSTLLLKADLLDIDALPRLIDAAVTHFGRLDVLVNNASTFYPTPVGGITLADWTDLMGTNLRAPLFLSQAAAPALKKSAGAIINIVDIHAERPLKDYVVYSIAKAGLVALTRSLSRELGPEIRVNGVAPGAILWPDDGAHFSPAQQQAIIEQSSLKRAGIPEDIANTVKFFAFDAPYVTGQILAVDGGRGVNL